MFPRKCMAMKSSLSYCKRIARSTAELLMMVTIFQVVHSTAHKAVLMLISRMIMNNSLTTSATSSQASSPLKWKPATQLTLPVFAHKRSTPLALISSQPKEDPLSSLLTNKSTIWKPRLAQLLLRLCVVSNLTKKSQKTQSGNYQAFQVTLIKSRRSLSDFI